ncbi:MAG: phage scaffolding protein [Clostridiales bacterium]|jgi:hypothetical protein|nr:phage scaffolding protein [Clostridiales bacterium]
MEWLEKILEGADNAAELAGKIGNALPKHFIPKEKYNELAEGKRLLEQNLKAAADDRVRDVALRSALRSLTGEQRVRDVDLVTPLIDKGAVHIDEHGAVCGLEEQIAAVRREKPYLFGDSSLAGRVPLAGAETPPAVGKEQFARMNYRERRALYERQPELYKNLMS